jgi:hypothetical protein
MNPARKAVIGAAFAGSTLLGGALGASLIGSAATADTTSTTSTPAATSTAPAPAPRDPHQGGHMANGVTETLLTGDTATKVQAAAQAAVPDGTILRVENDAEGSPYEAHMSKADGSQVTVKVDSNFKVTSIENGPR